MDGSEFVRSYNCEYFVKYRILESVESSKGTTIDVIKGAMGVIAPDVEQAIAKTIKILELKPNQRFELTDVKRL